MMKLQQEITVPVVRLQIGQSAGGTWGRPERSFPVSSDSRDGIGTAPGFAMSFRPRIAVASPLSRECTCIADWLTPEGFEPFRLSNPTRVTDELKDRAFDLLVVDAGLAMPAINTVRVRTPLIPIVVLGEPDPIAESQAMARGAVYLTRPIDRTVFVCTVAMAIMESRPIPPLRAKARAGRRGGAGRPVTDHRREQGRYASRDSPDPQRRAAASGVRRRRPDPRSCAERSPLVDREPPAGRSRGDLVRRRAVEQLAPRRVGLVDTR